MECRPPPPQPGALLVRTDTPTTYARTEIYGNAGFDYGGADEPE